MSRNNKSHMIRVSANAPLVERADWIFAGIASGNVIKTMQMAAAYAGAVIRPRFFVLRLEM